MAQTESKESGFSIPQPKSADTSTPAPEMAAPSAGVPADTATLQVESNTSSRDTLVGGAILLVLFVVFFFAKNAYANYLVGKKVQPSKANLAGWCLFVFLASIAIAGVLAAVSPAGVSVIALAMLGVSSLAGLIFMFVAGRR